MHGKFSSKYALVVESNLGSSKLYGHYSPPHGISQAKQIAGPGQRADTLSNTIRPSIEDVSKSCSQKSILVGEAIQFVSISTM